MSALPCSRSLPWLAKGLTPFGVVMGFDLLLDTGFTIGPFDLEIFFGEQACVVSDQFRRPLDRRRSFENELFSFSVLHNAYRVGADGQTARMTSVICHGIPATGRWSHTMRQFRSNFID